MYSSVFCIPIFFGKVTNKILFGFLLKGGLGLIAANSVARIIVSVLYRIKCPHQEWCNFVIDNVARMLGEEHLTDISNLSAADILEIESKSSSRWLLD